MTDPVRPPPSSTAAKSSIPASILRRAGRVDVWLKRVTGVALAVAAVCELALHLEERKERKDKETGEGSGTS